MTEDDRQRCALLAGLHEHQRKVARALDLVAEALERIPHPYVGFSGGADSTVLLDMVLRQRPDVPIVWGDDGWDFGETLAFLAATEARYGFRLVRVRSLDPWRSWCRELGRPDLAETPDAVEDGRPVWGNPPGWDATWRSLTKDAGPLGGFDGALLGVLGTRPARGGESNRRAQVLREGARTLYQVDLRGHCPMWHANPLAAFTKADVWSYVVSRGLPYNPVYDRLAALGVPLERRRVAALTCFRAVQYGSHTVLRSGWPELFGRLATIFPAVRALG